MPEQNSSISNFKRFFLRILLPLVLIISLAGLVFNYYFEKNVILKSNISGIYKVNRILKETHPDEIPIFGSSRAEGGFIPDSLGKDYFNYGLYGAFYDVTLFFLEEECKKTKTRPWIILNLDLYGLMTGLGDISTYVYNANDPAVKKLLGDQYQAYYRIPFLKYYGLYENYFRLLLSNKIELTKVSNKGAMLEKNPIPEKEFRKMVDERRETIPTFFIDSALNNKLFEIINTHPDRNFVFVVAPYHSSCFVSAEDKIKDSFFKQLLSHKNVRLLDFSKMDLPDSMYLNTTHINLKGAIVFDRQLRDSLTALGIH